MRRYDRLQSRINKAREARVNGTPVQPLNYL
jgi:hypothetical protein